MTVRIVRKSVLIIRNIISVLVRIRGGDLTQIISDALGDNNITIKPDAGQELADAIADAAEKYGVNEDTLTVVSALLPGLTTEQVAELVATAQTSERDAIKDIISALSADDLSNLANLADVLDDLGIDVSDLTAEDLISILEDGNGRAALETLLASESDKAQELLDESKNIIMHDYIFIKFA